MKIGIDLDQVVADSLPLIKEFTLKRTGKILIDEDYHNKSFRAIWDLSPEEANRIEMEMYQQKWIYKAKPINGAKDSLTLLSMNYDLYIITARPILLKEETTRWINETIFPFDENKIIFSSEEHKNNKGTKAEICSRIGVELIVEDSGKNALSCAEIGISCLLFDNPWNLNFSHEKIHRVYSWDEAVRKIETISSKNR